MSKFKRNRVYMIIPDIEVTPEIINASASRTRAELPSKTQGGVLYRLVECPLPCPDVVSKFEWFDNDEIQSKWDNIVAIPTSNKYAATINVRQGAATAAGQVVWAMRHDVASLKTVFVEKINLEMAFDTLTPLARSSQRYSLQRFHSGTPTGGLAIQAFRFDPDSPTSQMSDIRQLPPGLTIPPGLVLANDFAIPNIPATDGSTSRNFWDGIRIRLKPGDGLCLTLLSQAVVGQYIGGNIIWDER